MAIRKFHMRNKNQLCMYLPKEMVEELNWEHYDNLKVEIEGRTIILYKDESIQTILKKTSNNANLISLSINPPKNTRGVVNIKKVDDSIVIKFL